MAAILLLKVTLILVGTLAAGHLLGRAPAVARHRLWSGVFIALLALPLLIATVPAVRVPVPADWLVKTSLPHASNPPMSRRASEARSLPDRRVNWDSTNAIVTQAADFHPDPLAPALPSGPMILALAWLLGAAAATVALIVSLRAVRRLDRDADIVSEPDWQAAADRISKSLGLPRRARLLWSAAIASPMAGGFARPAIFLPDSARHWSAEQRDIVLTHEIAHLVARDPLRHLLARLALACYWFHPLAWLAARQASIAREQACDEVVLSRGIRPSAYARMLLDLAESLDAGAPMLGALPMVQRTLLEQRVMSILDNNVRPASRLIALIPVVCVAAVTLPLAAVQPATSQAVASIEATSATIAPVPSAEADGPAARRDIRFDGEIRVTASPQAVDRDSACWWDPKRGASFNGSLSMSEIGGRTLVREHVGWRGSDRVIQKDFGDLRVCMLAEGIGDRSDGRPSEWIDRAMRVVIETERRGLMQRLEIERQAGRERTSWRVGGADRAFDAAARQWQSQTLAVLDTTWELSSLRGRVSSLRGEISSIHGERSSLQGEISSLHGEVSSMRGSISSVRGEESSLRGEISAIRGHLSSLQGSISSERGAISSLTASRYDPDAAGRRTIANRIADHEAEIQRLEREIRDFDADGRVAAVEKTIAVLDSEGKVAAIEARIKTFDLDGRIAAVEQRIKALDVEGRVRAIQKEIEGLDADRRGRQLEERRDNELKRLVAAIGAVK